MRYIPTLILLSLLPSCTMLKSLNEAAARTGELARTTSEFMAKAEGQIGAVAAAGKKVIADAGIEFATAKAEADTNNDGRTSPSEWLAYILALLGSGGGMALEARRRISVRNAESDARKTRLEDRVERLEKPST